MTPAEEALIQAYEDLGRPDLGGCVRRGRLFHRLQELLRIPLWTEYKLWFALISDSYLPGEQRQWLETKKTQYSHDDGLQALLSIQP